MSKLQGKTALVTGASKGIGAGIAKELAASGAAVVVNYATDRNGAEAVVNVITNANGRAAAAQADLLKRDDGSSAAEQLARLVPNGRVVTAFTSISSALIRDPASGERPTVYLRGR
jgi:NAD(P)-dependent dehydrogenase (short-subunit alcohol dehydrogenase family)